MHGGQTSTQAWSGSDAWERVHLEYGFFDGLCFFLVIDGCWLTEAEYVKLASSTATMNKCLLVSLKCGFLKMYMQMVSTSSQVGRFEIHSIMERQQLFYNIVPSAIKSDSRAMWQARSPPGLGLCLFCIRLTCPFPIVCHDK